VEGSGVGGLVAEIEGEEFLVGDMAVEGIEAGIGSALGAVGEPMGFGHAVDEDGFGFGDGLMFVGQGLF
jgi:hypothetical protein